MEAVPCAVAVSVCLKQQNHSVTLGDVCAYKGKRAFVHLFLLPLDDNCRQMVMYDSAAGI